MLSRAEAEKKSQFCSFSSASNQSWRQRIRKMSASSHNVWQQKSCSSLSVYVNVVVYLCEGLPCPILFRWGFNKPEVTSRKWEQPWFPGRSVCTCTFFGGCLFFLDNNRNRLVACASEDWAGPLAMTMTLLCWWVSTWSCVPRPVDARTQGLSGCLEFGTIEDRRYYACRDMHGRPKNFTWPRLSLYFIDLKTITGYRTQALDLRRMSENAITARESNGTGTCS